MDVSHQNVIAICPHQGCGQRIRISVGRFRGGCNDRGGFIVSCNGCNGTSYIAVPNPNDASRVAEGGKLVATWDDEVEDMLETLTKHGVSLGDELSERMLVQQSGSQGHQPQFSLADEPIYTCAGCHENLEAAAYEAIGSSLDVVNDALMRHINLYLKGYETRPDAIQVTVSLRCKCRTHDLTFFKNYVESEGFFKDPQQFVLAGPESPDEVIDIDGIYSRDECVAFFKKLLLRWQARDRVVMLVVPFIGLDYPGREADRMALWNIVLGHTKPSRTMLVTRKGTWDGFLKAAEKTGLDIALLRKFGILAPMLEQFHSDDAFFKQQSHAKFYAAIGPDVTEVLSGSFNIHSGGYAENMTFKSYRTSQFILRYLMPLGVMFDLNQVPSKRYLLKLHLANGKLVSHVAE